MVMFLTKAWMEEYRKMLNQSKEYKEAGKGWGVGWNGDFIFQIENIPIDKIPLKELPTAVANDLKEYVVKGTIYNLIRLENGECKDARPIKDPKEVQVGFVYKGPYENWKKMVKGEVDPIRALLARQFFLEGDMAKVMKYTKAANLMSKTSASIKSEFPDELRAKK
jgi:putative sterol carrier protein